MTKALTPSELADQLRSLGLDIPEELSAKIDNEFEDNAVEAISARMIGDDTSKAVEWQDELFSLADRFVESFTSETVNSQGRGNSQIVRTQVSIETRVGTMLLKVVRPA